MKQVTRFVSLAVASALVACASQAPVSSTAGVASHGTVPATVSDAPKQDKSAIPYGYRRVMVNGQERFCKSDTFTGSRAKKEEICLSRAQMDSLQDSSRDFIQGVQRAGAVNPNPCTPGAAGAMSNRGC